MRGRSGLALEVVAGMNLAIPSKRTPTGLYVLVSTPYGQCNTSKAAMTNRTIVWNQTLTIHGWPLKFPRWLMPIFSRKSKAVHLEVRASYESGPMLGRGEPVGTFETTFEQLLGNDGQLMSLSAVDNKSMSLELKVWRSKSTQVADHAAGSTEQSAIGRSTDDEARDASILFGSSNFPNDLNDSTRGFQSVLITSSIPHANQISSSHHGDLHHEQQSVAEIPGSEQQRTSSQLSPPGSLNNRETRAKGRNVVIFGETGAGKSSIINIIAQQKLAKASNDATGCTFSSQRYPVEIFSQRFVLFDTAGLNEGTEGTVPAAKAERQLKSLLRELMNPGSDGISLLVYCVHSTTAPHALARAYDTFYAGICQKRVPIVAVVTGLEGETRMEHWWDTNGAKFRSHDMQFADHACVTVLQEYPGIPEVFTHHIKESSEILRNLVVNNCSDWALTTAGLSVLRERDAPRRHRGQRTE